MITYCKDAVQDYKNLSRAERFADKVSIIVGIPKYSFCCECASHTIYRFPTENSAQFVELRLSVCCLLLTIAFIFKMLTVQITCEKLVSR